VCFVFQLNKHYLVDQKNYGTSKLCNVWTAGALARKYKDKGIKAFSLHPGSLIATSKLKYNLQTGTIIVIFVIVDIAQSAIAKIVTFISRPFTKSLQQGASTTVYCTVAQELKNNGIVYTSIHSIIYLFENILANGAFFRDNWIYEPTAQAKDASLQDKLIVISDALISRTVGKY
jgi:WW domain-containing oxidoreductase